jgi:beta-1,4-mannosyltransferase
MQQDASGIGGDAGGGRRLRVLQSVARPRPTSNPYLWLLFRHAPRDVVMDGFSWRQALLGRYDVLHVHWPELLMRGTDRPRTWARRVLAVLLLIRLSLNRTAVVRTAHNEEPHEAGTRFERAVLARFDRATTHWIVLTPSSSLPPGSTATVIPHGHYREWFAEYDVPASRPGRLVFFGLVRPYKGVVELVEAFRSWAAPDATLHVLGRPQPPPYGSRVEAAAEGDGRIRLELAHVDDATLAREIGQAELVVLPYREMRNSGALLLALSLGRPVLAPATATTAEIGDEVGPGWVLTYEPPLTAQALDDALRDARSGRRGTEPRLGRRDWAEQSALLSAVYGQAVVSARRSRSR